jgi:hypothetical protein
MKWTPDPKPEPRKKKEKKPISRILKDKPCSECKKMFTPKNAGHEACSLECSIDIGKRKVAEKEKKDNNQWKVEKKELKEKHKTWSSYVKDIERYFNAYIRERDKSMPCISCDALAGTYKLTAGHFYPTTYQILRFNEDNVHSQCWFNCNKNKHGNVNEYRIRLIKKIGLERVEWLDNNRHEKLDLTIPELVELKEVYKDKLKLLKSGKSK